MYVATRLLGNAFEVYTEFNRAVLPPDITSFTLIKTWDNILLAITENLLLLLLLGSKENLFSQL